MRRTLDHVRAVVLAAATAAALGFGALQASARPAQPRATTMACDTAACTSYCQSIYGIDAIGRCTATGGCRCLF
jgi:hypothetical protein